MIIITYERPSSPNERVHAAHLLPRKAITVPPRLVASNRRVPRLRRSKGVAGDSYLLGLRSHECDVRLRQRSAPLWWRGIAHWRLLSLSLSLLVLTLLQSRCVRIRNRARSRRLWTRPDVLLSWRLVIGPPEAVASRWLVWNVCWWSVHRLGVAFVAHHT